MESRPWDNGTRVVHAALAITVLAELSTGLIVSQATRPRWLVIHSILGIATTFVIIVDWMWTWARRDLPILFPWNRAGMRVVGREAVQVFQGKLPGSGDGTGLSSFMHGIGLLAVSGMAITGLLMYMKIPGGYGLYLHSSAYAFFTMLATTHLYLSYVVWAYLIGHVFFAALQQVLGHNVLRHFYLGHR